MEGLAVGVSSKFGSMVSRFSERVAAGLRVVLRTRSREIDEKRELVHNGIRTILDRLYIATQINGWRSLCSVALGEIYFKLFRCIAVIFIKKKKYLQCDTRLWIVECVSSAPQAEEGWDVRKVLGAMIRKERWELEITLEIL